MRIGVTHSPREIELKLPDDADRDELRSRVEEVLGGEGSGVLWVTDRRGRQVAVPSDRIAYVELGGPAEDRPMGFSS